MTDYYDSGREREFYTYYDAYRALSDSDPPFTDLFDAEAAARHEPKLASDPTLTAFCQLGALRMNTKRCMVFFFDQTNGYVLAESTQSHHSEHAGDLWLGNTIIPRGLSVCEHSINIPEANKGSNQGSENAGEIHIINDFLEDQRFCDRPYVKDGPKARFYAGVPIKTPRGANIGAYCVLGEEPRQNGITDEDVDFMKHMGSLVMSHLCSLRESAEFGRGARMLQGLGVITREDDHDKSQVEGMAERMADQVPRNSGKNSSHTSKLSEYVSDYAVETDEVSHKRLKSCQRKPPSPAGSNAAPPLKRAPVSSDSTSTCHMDGYEPASSLDKQIRDKFQEASSLLLDAVKSDGVVFLDACLPKSASDHATSHQFSRLNAANRHTDDSDSSERAPTPSDKYIEDSGPRCGVLGHAEANSIGAAPLFENMISERFLRSLMRRYPKGKSWTFDADGQESSEKFLEDLARGVGQSDKGMSATVAKTLREAVKLQRLFNMGLRTLCFAPMWDSVRERFYAAILTWSKSPRHGFSGVNELSYLNAFADITMAEILRIEARQEAKSRAALLSSVSHELRTPLQGILGSIDLLKGAVTLDLSLIEQVQKCSLNLVDIVDHLLDFAKINSKATPRDSSDTISAHRKGEVVPEAIPLARTTEAIVDAVFYSHYFSNRDRTRPHVDLIVELAPNSSINCVISVGAWKRLCTNIVNNALKYTPAGFVKVSLDVSSLENGEILATLIVADTGIGMSTDFLKTSLFKSFAQEDPLAVGTGLGMSLVAQIVKEFGGQIEVTSKRGEGTTITVTVPLQSQPISPDRAAESECPETCVGFIETQTGPETKISDHVELIDTTKRTLRNLGVVVTSMDDAATVAVLEDDFVSLQSQQHDKGRRWLVLCETFASATHLRGRFQGTHAEFVPQPYGPERLSSAVQKLCFSDSQHSNICTEPSKLTLGPVNEQSALTGTVAENELFAALPSPPLDISLEHLSLDSSDATTIKASAQPLPTATHMRHDSDTINVAVGGQIHARPSPADMGRSSDPTKPLCLLLVDDNSINLKLLTMIADRNDFPRFVATSGKEAVDTYKFFDQPDEQRRQKKHSSREVPERRPDVILLDLNMPVMDGYEAAQQIRRFEKQAGLARSVIVAITGLGDDVARARAYQHGFDYFMSKPVRPQQLTDMLASIMEAKKSTQEH